MTLQIMVVDDEPDVTDLFRQQFRRELRAGQFGMDFAHSAPDALRQISAMEEASLIMVFSDINMPGMTGLEFLPRVKAIRPDVPVVMITAYGDEDTRRMAIENGASGLMTKLIDFGALRLEIGRRLDAHGRSP